MAREYVYGLSTPTATTRISGCAGITGAADSFEEVCPGSGARRSACFLRMALLSQRIPGRISLFDRVFSDTFLKFPVAATIHKFKLGRFRRFMCSFPREAFETGQFRKGCQFVFSLIIFPKCVKPPSFIKKYARTAFMMSDNHRERRGGHCPDRCLTALFCGDDDASKTPPKTESIRSSAALLNQICEDSKELAVVFLPGMILSSS